LLSANVFNFPVVFDVVSAASLGSVNGSLLLLLLLVADIRARRAAVVFAAAASNIAGSSNSNSSSIHGSNMQLLLLLQPAIDLFDIILFCFVYFGCGLFYEICCIQMCVNWAAPIVIVIYFCFK